MTDHPLPRPGRAIGLLGGSFDPAHEGHARITLAALSRFGLDEVWWLVSPGNPLKRRGPAPLEDRIAVARRLIRHPRVTVTGIEADLGTHYTAETLRELMRRYRRTRFVWLMGADNLVQFHLWQDWRWIMETVPVGVLARPGQRIGAQTSVAARVYRVARLPQAQSHLLGQAKAPAWCFINVPMSQMSSSEIRARGAWRPGSVEAPNAMGVVSAP